eukprot:scaffold73807_cov60-Phaeocystis_antarctica.AAC.1
MGMAGVVILLIAVDPRAEPAGGERPKRELCSLLNTPTVPFLRRSKDQKRKERELPGAAPAACGERGVCGRQIHDSDKAVKP